jgi:hypothetical protein
MGTLKPYFLGVSSYLHEDAVGHYLGVHTDYHNELVALSISNSYLGSDQGKGALNWVNPVISFIPTKLLNFDQIIKQIKLFFYLYKSSSVGGKIFVFEGNLNYWLVLCLVCRLKKSSAHINLIRSDLVYEKLIIEKNLLYKIFFYICAHLGKGAVSVSTFSLDLSDKLNHLYPINAGRIPTFSGFSPKLKLVDQLPISKEVLIFAPYLYDLKRLQQVLEEFPGLEKRITISTWQSDNVVENLKLKGVRIFNSHLSDREYELLLINSSHVVLLYLNEFHQFGSSSKVYDCVMVNRNICVPIGTEVANQALDCSNYYMFDGRKNEDIFKSIVSPSFINNYNTSNVPNVELAVKHVLSTNIKSVNRFGLIWSILGVIFYLLFLSFGLVIVSFDLFKKQLRKLFSK